MNTLGILYNKTFILRKHDLQFGLYRATLNGSVSSPVNPLAEPSRTIENAQTVVLPSEPGARKKVSHYSVSYRRYVVHYSLYQGFVIVDPKQVKAAFDVPRGWTIYRVRYFGAETRGPARFTGTGVRLTWGV